MRPLLLAALLASTSLPALAQEPTQTLRIALAEDADILDPTLARTFVGRIVFMGLCDKLFDINEKLAILPQLATGYDYTDQKTLILHIRDGVTFHDGEKLDAAAVKYSLERHATMAGSTRKAELSAMDHVDVVDPLTVKIVLKSPSAPFISQLADRAGMIVSPKAAEAAGKEFGLRPVCAGPFKFTERVAQDHITLDRYPGYWDAANVHFARVTYQIMVNSTAKFANLQAGAVDIAERLAATDVPAAKANPKIKVNIIPSLGFQAMNFNISRKDGGKSATGQSALVRKALELSIDRQALVDVVYNGIHTPVSQGVPASSPYHAPEITVPGRDVAKAKALLAQAGVKTPVPVTLTVSTNPDQQQSAEVIQSMAAEAGFEVKVQATEFTSLLSQEDAGDFQANLEGWSGRVDPDGDLYSFLQTGAPLNNWQYSNKDVDTWLNAARATTDVAERRALYGKVAAKVHDDLPIMYLYTTSWVTAVSSKLTGFQPVADGMIRIKGMTLAK
jgi:peptide/nickel transport system substrate-binding protein